MQNFNYHTHTYRCKHTERNLKDEEIVKEFIKKGFKTVAFTDHCPQKNKIDKRPNMRMDYSEKEDYLNSIKKLQEKYSISNPVSIFILSEYFSCNFFILFK